MAETVKLENGLEFTDYQSGAPDAIKNEKRALLALMAEYGTDAQAEMQKQIDASTQRRAASMEKAATYGLAVHAPRALGTEMIQDYDTIQGTPMASNMMAAHGRSVDRTQAASAAYMDAIAAASGFAKEQFNHQLAAQQFSGGGGGGGGGGGRGGGGNGNNNNNLPDPNAGEPGAIADLLALSTMLGQAGKNGTRQEHLNAIDDLLASGAITEENAKALYWELEKETETTAWDSALRQAQAAYNPMNAYTNGPRPSDFEKANAPTTRFTNMPAGRTVPNTYNMNTAPAVSLATKRELDRMSEKALLEYWNEGPKKSTSNGPS